MKLTFFPFLISLNQKRTVFLLRNIGNELIFGVPIVMLRSVFLRMWLRYVLALVSIAKSDLS